jgi:hypothetical protein
VVNTPQSNAFNTLPLFLITTMSNTTKPIKTLIKINIGDIDKAKKPRLMDIKVILNRDGLVQQTKNKRLVLPRSE